MAFDIRLSGLWVLPERQDDLVYELSPSGRLFIHGTPIPYRVAADGMSLEWVDPPPFERIGDPATSIVGSWRRHYPADNDTETMTYDADGSYLITWDAGDNYWGLYEDLGNALRTVEFRGTVSTEADRYRHRFGTETFDYRYAVQGDGSFIVYDDANGLQFHYRRSAQPAG